MNDYRTNILDGARAFEHDRGYQPEIFVDYDGLDLDSCRCGNEECSLECEECEEFHCVEEGC